MACYRGVAEGFDSNAQEGRMTRVVDKVIQTQALGDNASSFPSLVDKIPLCGKCRRAALQPRLKWSDFPRLGLNVWAKLMV